MSLLLWTSTTGVNTGFPIGGGAKPPGGPTYDFAKFSKKLHEIEKILVCRGVHTGGSPLDLLLNKVGYVIQI